MAALSPELREDLEKTIVKARELAEKGAMAALKSLAVHKAEAPGHLSAAERELRNRLRAKSRQLGDRQDKSGSLEINLVVQQCAYEYWHQMLFARFLAENDLLIEPDMEVAVSLSECEELAAEAGIDAWDLAAQYASSMLPQIFRPHDPLLQVKFALEYRQGLEKLLLGLDAEVFRASDSLGWVYQFWQAKRKKEINESGVKIGAAELPVVTQLFTEHYIVEFLLHNTLGAWWVANHPGEELPIALPYLRLLEDGTPAAGTFPGLPKSAKELKYLDPCCGSGHFLIEAFRLLVYFRMYEEGLTAKVACDAVIQENIYGLEIDERCTQIAAFALALAAWTFPEAGGYRGLPLFNIACCGIDINAEREDWLNLAKDDFRLRLGMARLWSLFENASTLGSLINPVTDSDRAALEADYDELEPLLIQALNAEPHKKSYVTNELGITAQGIAIAAKLLAGSYHLIATNVPYLTRGKQDQILKEFCQSRYADAKADLATVFLDRCLNFLEKGSIAALVTPQNWLFLASYKDLRKRLLKEESWDLLARLGEGAFDSPQAAGAFVALLLLTHSKPQKEQILHGIEASEPRNVNEKAELLKSSFLQHSSQNDQANNPDSRIVLGETAQGTLLSLYAGSYQGIKTGDDPRFRRFFWELPELGTRWQTLQSTVEDTCYFGGLESIVDWSDNGESMARLQGIAAWDKPGVAVSQMRHLPCTLFHGDLFDSNVSPIIPHNPEHLPAIWAFCSSSEFSKAVRRIDQKINVANSTLVKVPFDLLYWQKIADKKYRFGLPEPYSDDSTQWIFEGSIIDSTDPLQVAVARLLGYRWHNQPADPDLDPLIDRDGIVCLPAVRGEAPATDRLRALLAKVYDDTWSSTQLKLLESVGYGGKTLDDWLRNGFFEQHCKRFHQRPFLWQIWDGHKTGFSAIINYHKLNYNLLETLTYTYLGDWIRNLDPNSSGADAKLLAAQTLQKKLQLILEGEKPYDIFVRWKSLEEQAIGWHPDLNDGVRLNIRPFVEANILRKKPSISWNKDRGKNPPNSPWGEDRLNDLHLSLEEKRTARKAAKEKRKS